MQEVMDKGEVLIFSNEDLRRLAKYIQALHEGNESYKPEGLIVRRKSQSVQSAESDKHVEPIFENNLSHINFTRRS